MDALPNLQEDLEKLIENLRVKIRDTPYGPPQVVNAYHRPIIQELDSYEITSNFRPRHKMLHQEMWIQGHKVFDSYKNVDEAAIDFIGIILPRPGQPKNLGNGEEGIQKARFDIFYAQTYLLSIPESKRDDWTKNAIKEADEEAITFFYCRVDELDVFDRKLLF
jgi:hypothetical protein